MKSKKLSAMFAVAMSLSLVATACGQKVTTVNKVNGDLKTAITQITKGDHPEKNPSVAKNRKDTLVIGIQAPDGVFNPLFCDGQYDMWINETMFDCLCDVDSQGNMIPGVAEKFEISPDGLTYTYHIRKGVKFSDGTPFTASDVEFTFDVLCDKSYDGPTDSSADNLVGYDEYNKGTANKIAGIQVVDPQTIKFTLTKPNAADVYSFGGVSILSKAYYGKDYKQGDVSSVKKINRTPMGDGQYKLASFKDGVETDLVANENYYKGAPKIKNIIFKPTSATTNVQLLSTGETDLDQVTCNAENLQLVKQAGFLDTQIFPDNGYRYIGMDTNNPMFSDKNVRQALVYGLNRKQVVDTFYKGLADVCNEPQSTVSWAYNPDVNKYEYNVDKANQMLDAAGWKKGADGVRAKDGKKFIIHFAASTPSKLNDVLIPILKDSYAKIGITVVPEQMDFNALLKKVESNTDVEMYCMGWGLVPDPDMTTIFKTNGSQNYQKYTNPQVDDLLQKGLAATKQADRAKIYKDMNKILNDDLPYIFLTQVRQMWAVNCRVKGITIAPYRDFTYDLWHAELQ